MMKKLFLFLILFMSIPPAAFPDCTDQCYDSKCVIDGACEMKCENNICYYYDDEGNCWKYDKDHGYYPCGCDCYKCDDSCYHDDNDHHHDCDDDWDDDYCCFIEVIKH